MALSKVLVLVLLTAMVAGCAQPAGPSGGPIATTQTSSTAPTGSVTVETDDNETLVGSIEGQVLDDETRPLSGATVTIPALRAEVMTAEDGRFQFENVPAGLQVLSATAPGHDPLAKTVEVRPDEATSLNFVLVAIPEGPRYVALPHTFLIKAGVLGTGFPAIGAPGCESCQWAPTISPGPSYLVLEIKGKHAVKHPTRPDGLQWFMYKNGSSTTLSHCNYTSGNPDPPCNHLPIRRELNETQLLAADPVGKPMEAFRVLQWCDPFWFCVEERYDEWLTLFYGTGNASIPADYTAWPK